MKYNVAEIMESASKPYIIPFWHPEPPFGFLSQWWMCSFHMPLVDDPDTLFKFSSAEQYMMYCKAMLFDDERTANKVLNAWSPMHIKKFGRQVKPFDPLLWDNYKEGIVYMGNMNKFAQNKNLKEALLATGDSILVECSPYDRIWGIGLNMYNDDIKDPNKWKGQNLLGFTLMEVRDTIKNL